MEGNRFKHIGKYMSKALVLAYIITLVLVVVTALLLTYSSLKESTIPLINTIIIILSISIGSSYAAIKIGEKGWLSGCIFGILYFLGLLLLNKIFIKEYVLDIFYFSRFFIFVITGIIGGILGINLK